MKYVDRIVALIRHKSLLPLSSILLPNTTFLTNLIAYYTCEHAHFEWS